MQDSTVLIIFAVLVVIYLLFLRGISPRSPHNPPPHIHDNYLDCLEHGCYDGGEPIPDFVEDERLRPRYGEASGDTPWTVLVPKKARKKPARKKTPVKKTSKRKAPAKRAVRKKK